MAKYRFLNSKLFSICSIATILSSHFVTAVSLSSSDDSKVGNGENSLNITGLPPSVAQIVEAISNVQKNVSKAASNSKVPNIKVASLMKNDAGFTRNMTASNVTNSELELQLYEPEESFTPERLDVNNGQTSESGEKLSTSVTSTEKTINSNVNIKDTNLSSSSASEPAQQGAKKPAASNQDAGPTEENDTTPAVLNPPETGLLSFDGVRQWINWVRSVRDPNINPEGSLSWPTIVGRGFLTIIRYYNPLRRIFGKRSLNDPISIKTFSKEHPYREEILMAIKNKEISGDKKSINAFVHKLQRAKIAEKITVMSKTDKTASGKEDEDVVEDNPEPLISLRPLAAPVADAIESIRNFTEQIENALFAPFDFVPSHVHAAADLFDAPFNTVIRVPFYVKYANIALKALYILIPLIYIPYSGIENFFLAPLPPEMDTMPGMLRFFGLQALLGPDYLYDYADDEEVEGDEGTSAAADEEEYYDDDDEYYDDDVRRNRRKDKVDEKNKKLKERKRFKKKQTEEKDEVNGKETRYTNLAYNIRPPPSRYRGQSSYSSIMASQNIQPVYVYPLSDSNHPATPHPQTVQAPVRQNQYYQWKYFNTSPSLSGAQAVSPPFVEDSSVFDPSLAAGVPLAVTHFAKGEPVAPVPSKSGIHTFGTPLISNEPILSVPNPSSPSYLDDPSSIRGARPSEIVRDDQIDVSHYKPPSSFGTQLHRPVLQSGSNDALFSYFEEIRENFLVTPIYSGTTTTTLVSKSRTEVPHTSTSTTLAPRTEPSTSELRPVYVTAPTIIRTSTVVNRFPSSASLTP